ncbi:MAG: hypothetical protein U1A07_23485, partial [Phenylobacterium sp.]|nr:hypothetical protein [Phenylobacterium sp.]
RRLCWERSSDSGALVLDQGPIGQSPPLQRHQKKFGADLRRVRFRRPLFELHRLGQALRDRKHRCPNCVCEDLFHRTPCAPLKNSRGG